MVKKSVVERPSILVLHEKHEDLCFDALTEDALFRSALNILRGRFQEGYWYEHDEEFSNEVKLVISRKDGKRAWELLKERRDHEYEGFSIQDLMTKYPSSDDND